MLDKNYYPMYLYQKDFLKGANEEGAKPFVLVLERGDGEYERYETTLYANGHEEENLRYAKKLVKTMIWAYGGYKFYLYGGEGVIDGLRKAYSNDGERAFDYNFMQDVYLRPMEFVLASLEELPSASCKAEPSGANGSGYRIGFDAGGSDRKVTACIDGKVVYEKETVWFPKLNSDPNYHLEGILDSIDNALSALGGRVDAIGVSTAGIVVDNEVRVSSLFRKVSKKEQNEFVRPIYINLAKKYMPNGTCGVLAFGIKGGRKASIERIVERTVNEYIANPYYSDIHVAHADCEIEAQILKEKLIEGLNIAPEKVHIDFLGPIIGASAGPGTLAMFFVGTER